MTTGRPEMRIYLLVPIEEKEAAKAFHARWCPVRKSWWIDQRDLATNAGIHRWVVDRKLKASLIAAESFLRNERRMNAKPEVNREWPMERQLPLFDYPAPVGQVRSKLPMCAFQTPPWID